MFAEGARKGKEVSGERTSVGDLSKFSKLTLKQTSKEAPNSVAATENKRKSRLEWMKVRAMEDEDFPFDGGNDHDGCIEAAKLAKEREQEALLKLYKEGRDRDMDSDSDSDPPTRVIPPKQRSPPWKNACWEELERYENLYVEQPCNFKKKVIRR